MSTLGERLKSEREKRGWTKVYVANRLGLKRSSTYANWEYGIREPDLDMLGKLADLFEISLDTLSGNDNNDKNTDHLSKGEIILNEKMKLAEEILKLPDDKQQLIIDMVNALSDKEK